MLLLSTFPAAAKPIIEPSAVNSAKTAAAYSGADDMVLTPYWRHLEGASLAPGPGPQDVGEQAQQRGRGAAIR